MKVCQQQHSKCPLARRCSATASAIVGRTKPRSYLVRCKLLTGLCNAAWSCQLPCLLPTAPRPMSCAGVTTPTMCCQQSMACTAEALCGGELGRTLRPHQTPPTARLGWPPAWWSPAAPCGCACTPTRPACSCTPATPWMASSRCLACLTQQPVGLASQQLAVGTRSTARWWWAVP
jgi:hypothetical protein